MARGQPVLAHPARVLHVVTDQGSHHLAMGELCSDVVEIHVPRHGKSTAAPILDDASQSIESRARFAESPLRLPPPDPLELKVWKLFKHAVGNPRGETLL